MDDAICRVMLGVVIAGMSVVRIYRHAQAGRSGPAMRLEGPLNMALRAAAGLTGFVVLILYLASPQRLAWASVPLWPWLRWTGAVAGLASVGLLAWVYRELGRNFSATLHVRAEHTLVTSGPYHWVRHPMHTVFYGLCVSFLLLSANCFIGAIFLAGLTAVMLSRVNKEDAVMAARFPDQYPAWAAHTGRFLPRYRS
jgi:protein-S-isoprenylcysteine O-methyltransferase Ste14